MNNGINNLYVSEYDPKLSQSFVSISTKGVYGETEVTLTFSISGTGKMVLGELRVYAGYQVITKCAVKRDVIPHLCLDDTIRKVSERLLEIAGFSEVSYHTLSQIDYKQAGALVKELLRQLAEANHASTSIEITCDWRLL